MKQSRTARKFVLCIRNEDCEDLEPRKVYLVLPDERAAKDGYIRVIDESGEDYLYPQDFFLPIELPKHAEKPFCQRPKSARALNKRHTAWRLIAARQVSSTCWTKPLLATVARY